LIGVSIIYWPLAIVYLSIGNYGVGIGILVLLTIVTVVRQIVEPKLYASNLGLNPSAVLAAIFIGLKSFGFLGMIYFLALLVLLKIFNRVNLI
jgi:predicted PurR-regulated permease PerM